MRFLTGIGRARGRLVLLTAMVAALAIGGAAAKVGQAGTGTNGVLTATVRPLNQPSPGGNAGYDLNVTNGSTNTLNHLLMSDSTADNRTIVFVQAPAGVSCTGQGTTVLSCTTAQMSAGASFDITVLFQTNPNDTAGTPVPLNSFTGTYAPQTNNNSNSRTPSKTFSATNALQMYAGGNGQFVSNSLLLVFDGTGQGQTGVGGVTGQSSNIKMPPGFQHSNNFVGTTLQTLTGISPPNNACPNCLQFETSTTIPLATSVDSPNNPFLAGGTTSPYSWSFTIPVPESFDDTPVGQHGVYHTDDGNGNGGILPRCAIVGGQPVAPTTAPGICISSITMSEDVGPIPDTATFSGLGIANGNAWGY